MRPPARTIGVMATDNAFGADLTEQLRAQVQQALAAGTSPAEFEQLLQDLAQKRLTH